MPQKYTDQDLLNRFQNDPEGTLDLIFEQYYPLLFTISFRLLKQKNDAEDIVQETMLDFWNKRDKIAITTNLKSYLCSVVRNKSLNFIRDHRQKWDFDAEIPALPTPAKGLQKLEANELKSYIEQIIDGLPERCRIIFVLSRFENFSYKEIANTLAISEKTVEHQISKALKVLRTALKNYM